MLHFFELNEARNIGTHFVFLCPPPPFLLAEYLRDDSIELPEIFREIRFWLYLPAFFVILKQKSFPVVRSLSRNNKKLFPR